MDEILETIKRNKRKERLPDPSAYNDQIRAGWISFWTRNAARNMHIIERDYKADPAPDAAVYITENHRESTFMLGSGPSLNKAIPHLKNWEGDIWCSSSHLAILEANGITPTYCIIIDADPSMTFLVSDADTKDIILITHPCMERQVLEDWEGPILYFRMHDPGDVFFNEYLPMMYGGGLNESNDGIKSYVMNSGCVVNTAVALAMYCGYKAMFLAGVDFGFPDNVYRFTDMKRDGDGFTEVAPPVIPPERISYVASDGILSDTVGVFYKYSFLVIYGIDGPNVYSCSDGILKEIPYVSPEDAVAGRNIPEVSQEDKYLRAQKYLRRRGLYIIRRKLQLLASLNYKMKTFRRLRKIIVRLMVMNEKRHKRNYWPTVRGMLKATRVRVAHKRLIFIMEHTRLSIGYESYAKIQNVSALPKWRRWPFRLWFQLGKLWRQW